MSGMNERMKSSLASRRRVLADALRGACGAGVAGLLLGLLAVQGRSRPAEALRPPGALPEADFLGACVRCGLCVRDCPYDTLRLAEPGEAVTLGTPYFVAREVPCEMCEDIPCLAACPTGALDPGLEKIEDARMGVAVLVGQETCLNLLGLRCDVCYRVCPLIDEAITLGDRIVVMRERPGRIVREISIELDDQRDRLDAAFTNLHLELRRELAGTSASE